MSANRPLRKANVDRHSTVRTHTRKRNARSDSKKSNLCTYRTYRTYLHVSALPKPRSPCTLHPARFRSRPTRYDGAAVVRAAFSALPTSQMAACKLPPVRTASPRLHCRSVPYLLTHPGTQAPLRNTLVPSHVCKVMQYMRLA